jgi:hypothetical protein
MELLIRTQYNGDYKNKIFGVSIGKRLSMTHSAYNNKSNEWVVFVPSYDKNPQYDLGGNEIPWTTEKDILLKILNEIEKPENKIYPPEEGYYRLFDKLAEEKNLKLLRFHSDDITDISVIFDKIKYYYIHARFLTEYTLLLKDDHVDEVKTLLSLIGVYNED